MAKIMTEYDLLVSCPGDVDGVVELVKQVIAQFNETYSAVLAIRLNVKHWSKDSYNQSGGKAQELLNKQFIHDCDAAIAVFWTRFGSPTDRYGSGTEEEIEDMLASGKQVFLYFCEKPIKPDLLLNKNAKAQYKKVKAYQQRYAEGKGIYAAYSSDDEFKQKLFAHLSMHFLSLKKVAEITTERASELRLSGIENGKLCDSFRIEKYKYDSERTVEEWINEIKLLFREIDVFAVRKPTQNVDSALNSIKLVFQKKVIISDEMTDFIRTMAKELEIQLSEDFFSLGDLMEDSMSSVLPGGGNLYGTEDEKKKYYKIIDLYNSVDGLLGWAPFWKEYGKLHCIRLAIENLGKAFDEDIDISLTFPPNGVLKPRSLPLLDEYSCHRIMKDYSIWELFEIKATRHYNDFESSIQRKSGSILTQPSSLPVDVFGYRSDYREDFQKEIEAAFDYDFYEDEDGIVVKLHVDYLKHNTAVAFPTVLFVSDELKEIKYIIRSKHSAEETRGIIRVKREED